MINLLFSQHSTSNDPKKLPEIDPHYFEQSVGMLYFTPFWQGYASDGSNTYYTDLTLLLELTKRARDIANTLPMKDMIGRLLMQL